MVNTMELTNNIKHYIIEQISKLTKTNPVIGFMKPLITRALDKKFSKVTKALDLIADENGNIDVDSILTEMIDNIVNTNPFTLNTSFIGDVEIGGGVIKCNIPLTNKKLVLDVDDLTAFKEALIIKE